MVDIPVGCAWWRGIHAESNMARWKNRDHSTDIDRPRAYRGFKGARRLDRQRKGSGSKLITA
jgi:hypothetical protein